jgi:uncharacterized protein YfaS (alpha-2-macroglobulin family)
VSNTKEGTELLAGTGAVSVSTGETALAGGYSVQFAEEGVNQSECENQTVEVRLKLK